MSDLHKRSEQLTRRHIYYKLIYLRTSGTCMETFVQFLMHMDKVNCNDTSIMAEDGIFKSLAKASDMLHKQNERINIINSISSSNDICNEMVNIMQSNDKIWL